jgi:hypothetical protein
MQLSKAETALSQQEYASKYNALLSTHGEDQVSAYEESEPLSSRLYEVVTTRSPNRMSFFVTELGLCGFCMSGAQVGHTISVLFHGNPDYPNVPFIICPREDGRYSMITIAWVQNDWRDLARYRGTLESRKLIFQWHTVF